MDLKGKTYASEETFIKYMAKPNTWFKENTEVKLIENCQEAGALMEGTIVRDGVESIDQELCPWDEFYEVEVRMLFKFK